MLDECQLIYDDLKDGMEKSLVHLKKEYQKIRAGKSSPDMLDGVMVDYYGTITPISQTANITTPDPRQIIVQPWDKSILPALDKAILAANLGFTPRNEGEVLRIIIPAITEERRRELVKRAKVETENTKVSIRNLRRTAIDFAKSLEKEGVPEDDIKKLQADLQKLTDDTIEKIDKLYEVKEKDILTV